jgi:hypothetical protein
MVLTIEPGLYVAPGAREAPPELRGLGIRIEDDVLVTREGCEVLTDRVPKDPRAIETLMAEGRTAAAAVSAATTPHGASTTVRSVPRKGRRDAR